MNESIDLDFTYEDTDVFAAEMAELYSYTEECEFEQHKVCFYEALKKRGERTWREMSDTSRIRFIEYLQTELDMAELGRRDQAVQCLLYLIQGVFGECLSDSDQMTMSRANIYLIYENRLFASFVEVLAIEIEYSSLRNEDSVSKGPVSLADSTQLRYILNILYTFVETLRWRSADDTDEQNKMRRAFFSELNHPYVGDESLALMLFNMITRFCSGNAPHFPMKKVLLLLWKVILVTLGGLRDLQNIKNTTREKRGLAAVPEDPHEVTKTMRSSSPPANAADLIEQQLPRRSYRSAKRGGLMKQTGLEEQIDSSRINDVDIRIADSPEDDINAELENARSSDDDDMIMTPPRSCTPSIPHKALPWKPKVRKKDLEAFLDVTRMKFIGFQVKNDVDSLAGLPRPIHEGVKIIKQHLYTSLSEIQIQEEENLALNPLSQTEGEVDETPSEMLYQALLPCLPQHMIALLKVLLAAAPTSKAKTDSINVLCDVLPAGMPSSVLQSMKLGLDVNRHKEIIVKAVSAILLLLLKHFKLNHIYQFEFTSQHLVFANCIPLVLKFFNQNIASYVSAKNNINMIDFPYCVIGEPAELTAENLESGDIEAFCWRNLFSCINLLRILNKLTKWKHSRTMMLVVFKSAPILKRALKVRHAMMQLYVLKLLKMQTKYLGRQWRKSNMKTMSAIYQNVRHRLNDDWAYGNDIDARPWDFQTDECALRTCVDRFNNRRYTPDHCHPDFAPVDNCLFSVLGQEVELSEEFQENYEKWLEMEVFSGDVDWERILMT